MPSQYPLPAPTDERRRPVLLFDGDCGLCQALVVRLLRADRFARLRFAPLQGPTARAYLRCHGLPMENFDSLVYVADWSDWRHCPPLLQTDGACAALAELGGAWRVLALGRYLPHWLRDPCYRLVAKLRRRFFGGPRVGALARPKWENRLLH